MDRTGRQRRLFQGEVATSDAGSKVLPSLDVIPCPRIPLRDTGQQEGAALLRDQGVRQDCAFAVFNEQPKLGWLRVKSRCGRHSHGAKASGSVAPHRNVVPRLLNWRQMIEGAEGGVLIVIAGA